MILKRLLVMSAARFGLCRLVRQTHNRDLLVLVYHSIVLEPLPQPFRYHHTLIEFKSHLDWVASNCEPVGLDGVRKWSEGCWTGPKPPALITFDDGFRNNATIAADALSRKGMPAVFFLTTDYIGNDRVLWPDELFARILSWNSSSIRLPDGQLESVPAAYERTALAFRILQSCKDSPHERRLEWLDYLRESTPGAKVKLVPQAQDFMSWEEARTLVERGFELGSHTVAHPILSRISMAQLSRELKESRTAVEAKTGGRCIAIAYPNGSLMDYTPEVQQAVQQAGYEFGFVVSGHWSRRPLERFAIDRIPPPGHADAGTFAFHASGARALFGGE